MAAISLFWYTNMAAVTSDENDLLVNNAIIGIIIGLLCSLILLTIATTNVIIGVMATLTIAMVTCGVLAMISVVGWSLGRSLCRLRGTFS
jgi:hypothetical protein